MRSGSHASFLSSSPTSPTKATVPQCTLHTQLPCTGPRLARPSLPQAIMRPRVAVHRRAPPSTMMLLASISSKAFQRRSNESERSSSTLVLLARLPPTRTRRPQASLSIPGQRSRDLETPLPRLLTGRPSRRMPVSHTCLHWTCSCESRCALPALPTSSASPRRLRAFNDVLPRPSRVR